MPKSKHMPVRRSSVWKLGAALTICLTASVGVRAERYAITGVSVIPMDQERVVSDQTLLVRDGKIERYGPAATTKVPRDAKIIDGKGRYVIPGLSDMHIHFLSGRFLDGAAESVKKAAAESVEPEVFLFIANGVTTVRNTGGDESVVKLRDDINAGKMEGPRIFVASMPIDGDPPIIPSGKNGFGTAEKARAYVRETAAKKFDMIKVYSTLSTPVFDAVVDEAHKVGLPVIGHLPMPIDFDHALTGMRSIEHLSGFDIAFTPKKVEPVMANLYAGWAYGTENQIRDLAGRVAKAGVWNCPTLITVDYLVSEYDRPKLRANPQARYLPPILRDDTIFNVLFEPPHRSNLAGSRSTRLAIVKALSDAGAPLLTGSDTWALGVIAGFSIHRELLNFVEAGLTPYQALTASTSEPARFFNRVGEFGTIVPGASADLVLLAANPLENIANVDRIDGVMVRGRWYPQVELAQRLEAQAARFAEAPAMLGAQVPKK